MIVSVATTLHGATLAALVPVALIAVAFEVFCLVDVFRSEKVQYLPRWLWALITVVSVPLGGLVYLIVGRQS
jgi:Phospholipase_D-nuclease N-terminal